jgi:glycosyltransferase involved in cell wall biosynthesis
LLFSFSGIPDELHTLGNISIIRAKEGEDLPSQQVGLDDPSANFPALLIEICMHVGIVFHKNPFATPSGIDLVRLRAIAGGLIRRGISAEVLAPVDREGFLDEVVPVKRLETLEEAGRYDLVKTCYHDSILLIEHYHGPVVSRIVRVVDHELPERDEPFREHLIHCQELIRDRASAVVLNNTENRDRWQNFYGSKLPIALIPTGCPECIPPLGPNPYRPGKHVLLFLGSLAAPRMVHSLNQAARLLQDRVSVHLVGLNKACMYGGAQGDCALDPLVVDHGELSENHVWDYIRYASVGLALAAGPHAFDNDVSKILNYLRGGLPVVSEEPILTNGLIRQTGFGNTFPYGNVTELVSKALELIENPLNEKRDQVMQFMAAEHSWHKRVDTYVDLFRKILSPNASAL